MKIKKVDRKYERDIATGMITDRSFLAKIRGSYNPDYLKNGYAKTIAKWCVEYFDKYDDCPLDKIQDIFDYQDKRGDIDEDEVDLIEKLLENISDDFSNTGPPNTQFLIDKAEQYFNRVRLENLSKDINYELEEGTVQSAERVVLDSKEIRISSNNALDPLASEEKTRDAFESVTKPLFEVNGDIGTLLNEHLTRDAFLAIQAPEKTGKTWFLYWLAREALKNRLKVAIFQIGDMTENQSIVRMSISNAGRSNKKKYCGTFKVPVRFKESTADFDDKQCAEAPTGYDLEYKEITIDEPLDWREAVKENEKFYKDYRIKKDKNLKLMTVPANSINMREIDAELDKLDKIEGFVPDVVVVDYMDILSAENPKDIGRDKVNSNWINAKSLCNKRHILLLSATQASSESYDGEIQTRNSFSEDKRKYSHVNGMLGLNQNDGEKRAGLMKLNWILLREGEFSDRLPCYVAQSLRQGNPVCTSLIPNFQKKRPAPEAKEKGEERSRRRKKKERRKRS